MSDRWRGGASGSNISGSSSSGSGPHASTSENEVIGKVGLFSLIIYKCTTNSSSSFDTASNSDSISLSNNNTILLSSAINLSSFPFFHRSTLKQHILFHSRLVASRTGIGCRQRVEFEQNLGYCHVYVHPTGLTATALTTSNYPIRVAFGLIQAAIRQFMELYTGRWEMITADVTEGTLFAKEGAELLQTYQNPYEADKLLKVQKDLGDVKDIMMKNIDDLLQRGEKLEDLMEKSQELSDTSYLFYRQAKKNNQCCSWY